MKLYRRKINKHKWSSLTTTVLSSNLWNTALTSRWTIRFRRYIKLKIIRYRRGLIRSFRLSKIRIRQWSSIRWSDCYSMGRVPQVHRKSRLKRLDLIWGTLTRVELMVLVYTLLIMLNTAINTLLHRAQWYSYCFASSLWVMLMIVHNSRNSSCHHNGQTVSSMTLWKVGKALTSSYTITTSSTRAS